MKKDLVPAGTSYMQDDHSVIHVCTSSPVQTVCNSNMQLQTHAFVTLSGKCFAYLPRVHEAIDNLGVQQRALQPTCLFGPGMMDHLQTDCPAMHWFRFNFEARPCFVALL